MPPFRGALKLIVYLFYVPNKVLKELLQLLDVFVGLTGHAVDLLPSPTTILLKGGLVQIQLKVEVVHLFQRVYIHQLFVHN